MARRPFPRSLAHPRLWPSWLIAGMMRLLVLLPHPALMAIGRGAGRLTQRFASRRAAIARTNLRLCFPDRSEAEREALLAANFEAMGMGMMEVAMGWWWSRQRLERLLLGIEGEEHLPPLDDPRGTIYLTAHFTSLEISGRYLGHRRPSYAMYRRNENPVIQWLLERCRAGRLLGLIDRNDVRSMLKVLKAGGGVWFAPDQDFSQKGGVFADFMGVPAATTTATSRFAKMSGARVVPFVLFREPGGYRLVIEPALQDFPSQDATADAQRINDIFSRWAQRAPAQYNWIHRRFKSRPEGEPPIYD